MIKEMTLLRTTGSGSALIAHEFPSFSGHADPQCEPCLLAVLTLRPDHSRLLLHLPLLDAGRPILPHRNFKPQPRRRHGFEGDLIEAILLDTVRLGRFDRLPRLAVLV